MNSTKQLPSPQAPLRRRARPRQNFSVANLFLFFGFRRQGWAASLVTRVDVKKISAGLFVVGFCHNLPTLYPGGRVKSTDADVNCNVYCPRGGNQVRYVLTGATFFMHAARLLRFRLSLHPNHYPGPWVASRQCLAGPCSPSTVLNQAIIACPNGMSARFPDAPPGFTVRDS